MAGRWIVDVDGRGLFAVAEDASGRARLVSEPASMPKCERLVTRLRDRDARRAAAARVAAGHRLNAELKSRRTNADADTDHPNERNE